MHNGFTDGWAWGLFYRLFGLGSICSFGVRPFHGVAVDWGEREGGDEGKNKII